MKRGTLNHPKTRMLARLLRINRAWAGGILEALWEFTADYFPAGDIGKASDMAIAEAVFWPEDKSTEDLINALMDNEVKLLDINEQHRFIIHDWPDHCADWVHLKLARAGLLFADGSQPKTARLSKREREELEKRTESAQIDDSCAPPRVGECSVGEPIPSLASGGVSEEPAATATKSGKRAGNEPGTNGAHALANTTQMRDPIGLEARVSHLADLATNPQDRGPGIKAATAAIKASINPENALVRMEQTVPAWFAAMRSGRAREKTLKWVVEDDDWLRDPPAPRKSAGNSTLDAARALRTKNPESPK